MAAAIEMDAARALLPDAFGFDEFRPGQERVVASLLAGRSALAVFPTGAGKSLCYQLPALLLDGVTVVVSPLIALMKDQVDFMTSRGIAAARIDSSLGLEESRAVSERLRDGTLKLVYVAPERFNNERFLAQLGGTRIALFAVDEAHCISEWGHNFRPDYLKLAQRARELGAGRVLALTATATPAVMSDIRAAFGIAEADTVLTGFYRPNLTMLTTPVTSARRDQTLIDRLRERPAGSTIVYVTLQRTAERVAALLAAAGFPARPYHAGMGADERAETQTWWLDSDRSVVVATIAFGMGIDKSDVRYVYHYNLPKGLESYSQEIGRAGRDGAPSVCELLACADDVPTLENFAYGDTPTAASLEALLEDIFAHPPGVAFAVSELELSNRHDIRSLVLKTMLTYLELDGFLLQGTPFYAGYRLRPRSGSFEDVFASFDERRAAFLRRVVESGKPGRLWTSLDLDRTAAALGEDRSKIVAALGYLETRGLIDLTAADARQRYTILRVPEDLSELLGRLVAHSERREQAEIERIARVVALVTSEDCQVNRLVGYFGQQLDQPCGHCSHCLTGQARSLPDPAPTPEIDALVDASALASLAADSPGALGSPRQLARFLCGLTAPATSRAKLTRNPHFGALAEHRFGAVLEWCERR